MRWLRGPKAGEPSAQSPMKHALVVAVAVVYVAMSVAEGGYTPEAIAAGTLLIWWAVIVGLAVGAWPRDDIPRPALAAGLCIAGLTLLTALSLAWSSDDGRTFVEVVRVAGYTGLFVLVILSSRAGGARAWLVGLALGLSAVAVLALGSRLEPALPGGEGEIGEFIPSARGRLGYPIGYWNGLGALMALATVLLVWLGARSETRLGRSLAVGALPVVMLTMYLTSSRGGVAAMAIGLTLLVALGPARAQLLGGALLAAAGGAALVGLTGLRSALVDEPGTPLADFAGDEILLATLIMCAAVGLARYLGDRRLERVRLPRVPIRPALVALGVVAVGAAVAANPVARFEDFKTPPEAESGAATEAASTSGSGRYQFWSAAVDAFGEEPVTGIGSGGFETWWAQNGTISRTIRDAHSLYLETLAELGIGGVLLLVSFIGIGAVYGWRRRARGSPGGATEVALAVLVAGAFSAGLAWTWELPAAFVPVVVAVALLVGPATLRVPGASDRVRDGRHAGAAAGLGGRRSFGWGVLTLLLGWAAVWAAAVLLLTEIKLDDSRDSVDRFELLGAAQEAADASTLQPWAAQPWLQRALVEEQVRNFGAARRYVDKAIERAPEDWSLWYVASRIEQRAGNIPQAGEDYERARSLNPRAVLFTGGEDGEEPPASVPEGPDDRSSSRHAPQAPETPW